MNRIEFFKLLDCMSYADLSVVQTAYWLAKNAHRPEQNRDSGQRAFEHPREVAVTLIAQGHRQCSVVVKALLHDVIEDTNTPNQVIVTLFGHNIWRSLETLSKYIPLFDPVTGQTIARCRKTPDAYWGTLAIADLDDRLVKLADRFVNLSTMEPWDADRKRRYVEETRERVLPIAQATSEWFTKELSALIEEHGEA